MGVWRSGLYVYYLDADGGRLETSSGESQADDHERELSFSPRKSWLMIRGRWTSGIERASPQSQPLIANGAEGAES